MGTNGIKIEKGVPFDGVVRVNARNRYPWLQMDVGDSFLATPEKPENFKRNVYAQSKNGRSFVARDAEGGVRVWRIA